MSHDEQFLATGGQSGQVNIWQVQSELPELIATVKNTSAWVDRMAWSSVMRGFPGKIRQLAWSDAPTLVGTSLLASASAKGIVVWEKQEDESLGWEGRVLARHEDTVQLIRFQPDTLLLASAAADGWVCLWHKAQRLA